jgi:carboxymethylenebutenolidase
VLGSDDIPAVVPHMQSLDEAALRTDLTAALDWLAQRGIPRSATGTVGFCMGGTVALWAATALEIGAAVSYYGGGVSTGRFGLPPLVDLAPSLRCGWMGHYGGRDEGIPVTEAEALGAAAATAGVPTEMHLYPEAGHGFNCDDRDAFDPAASAEAWQRTLAWFDAHLRPGP